MDRFLLRHKLSWRKLAVAVGLSFVLISLPTCPQSLRSSPSEPLQDRSEDPALLWDDPEHTPANDQDPLLQVPTPTPPPLLQPSEIPATIRVHQFEVVGSTIFSAAELAAVTEPFRDRPLSFTELLQARSAVTEFYVEQGYITSGALIPPQSLIDGSITIQVIEGELETVEIQGLERLQPSYVQDRLRLAAQTPLNVNQLLNALQNLRLNPLIETLQAELSAGTGPGTSRLVVTLTEAPSFRTRFILDNGRSASVGSLQREVVIEEANLMGQGDQLRLTYTNTDGSDRLETSYTYPINARNGEISFSYTTSANQIIEEPFDVLDITSPAESYELTYRQPLRSDPGEELAFGFSGSIQETQTTLLGVPFGLEGTGSDGRARVVALRWFQDFTLRRPREVFSGRSQFSLGLNALDATTHSIGPDGRFFAWNGQFQWVRLMAPDTLLLIRSNLQFSDRSLLSLEQFGLGGIESVRGFRQDALVKDNGVFGSVEVRLPLYRNPDRDRVLHITPFLEAGTAWNHPRTELVPSDDPNTLAAVGVGLRWQHQDSLTARVDWGIPLTRAPRSRVDTWQENGIYFSIQYTPIGSARSAQ